MKGRNLYISVSRPATLSYQTVRMALHPGLPDVHTDHRTARDKRPYRMAYGHVRHFENEGPLHSAGTLDQINWYPSCLGLDNHAGEAVSFEEALAWLQGEEWPERVRWPVNVHNAIADIIRSVDRPAAVDASTIQIFT